MLQRPCDVFIRVEVERRAAAAGHVNGVIPGKLDGFQLLRVVQLGAENRVREEAFADQVVGLGRLFAIGITTGRPSYLSAQRTREVESTPRSVRCQ
jgi:hypothetical protein